MKSIDIDSLGSRPTPTYILNVLSKVKINFTTVNYVIRALPNKISQDDDGFSYDIL